MKKVTSLILVLLVAASGNGYAYVENYPPFSFKGDKPVTAEMKQLIGGENDPDEYRSEDGRVFIQLADYQDNYHFKLEVDAKVLLDVEGFDHDYWPQSVYESDLNGDGLFDLIVFSWGRGVGLGSHEGEVRIFLRKADGGYAAIRYQSFADGPEDFVDMNKDGIFEVVVGSFYFGNGHNYFVYSIYEIEGDRLVNADSKYAGFPKFIQYTKNPNDKPASDLTKEEVEEHLSTVQAQIQNS